MDFYNWALSVECHEKGHADQDINNKIRGQRPIEKKIDTKFKIFNPDDSDDIFLVINKINYRCKKMKWNMIN